MRPSLPVALLGSFLATLCLLQVVSAEADRGGPAKPPRASAFIVLEGSNGYEVLIGTVGRWVVLEALTRRVSATYMVPGSVTPRGIRARFGKLGRIAVEFAPLGGPRRSRDRCKRPPTPLGIFRGTIEFRGEDAYTEVSERSSIGLLFAPKPRHCRRAKARLSARPRRPFLDTHLAAVARRKGSATSFALARRLGNRLLALTATREERRGRMRIFRRSSTVVGGENAFISSGPGVLPSFAFLVAPKPFSGRALLDGGAAEGSQWSGTLAAWMPGAGKVALAGPDFALSFCRRSGDERPCDRPQPVRRPLLSWMPRLAQGSGSQSQAFWRGEALLVEVAAQLVELGRLDAVDVVGFGEVARADLLDVVADRRRPSSRGRRRSA